MWCGRKKKCGKPAKVGNIRIIIILVHVIGVAPCTDLLRHQNLIWKFRCYSMCKVVPCDVCSAPTQTDADKFRTAHQPEFEKRYAYLLSLFYGVTCELNLVALEERRRPSLCDEIKVYYLKNNHKTECSDQVSTICQNQNRNKRLFKYFLTFNFTWCTLFASLSQQSILHLASRKYFNTFY